MVITSSTSHTLLALYMHHTTIMSLATHNIGTIDHTRITHDTTLAHIIHNIYIRPH